jgi:hypothetical protein
MITSGLGKEFVIGHTLAETRLAGQRGIHFAPRRENAGAPWGLQYGSCCIVGSTRTA